MKQFFLDLLKAESGRSSRRFAGLSLIFTPLIILIICFIFAITISSEIVDIIKAYLYSGVALLTGVGIADAIKKIKHNQDDR